MLLGFVVVSAFSTCCSSAGGAIAPTLSAEGKLTQPIFKAADFRARPFCATCRVEFETEAPPHIPPGVLSLDVVGQDPEGVVHVALRMHGIPDRLLSVKGTLALVGDGGRDGSGLPVRYRGYMPGDLFATSGTAPCYSVNGALTSLIRFVGGTYSVGETRSFVSLGRTEGILLVLSFDLLRVGDVRIRSTELLAEVCEGDCETPGSVVRRRLESYGATLYVK